MIKLDIQRFGGRGATAFQKKINGVKVVNNTNGYQFWNIGKNAPKGYIGLIKTNSSGGRGETAYLKSSYSEEVKNTYVSRGMNAANIGTLKTQITKLENKSNKTQRDELTLSGYKRAMEIRKRLNL